MEVSSLKPIRVLIVDDSAFIRSTLSRAVSSGENMKVVGVAVNGQEGVEMAEELQPDVITLDITMPKMDGLEALKIITKKTSSKVLMLSSLTEEGANATFEALSLGAVDFIGKKLGDTAFSMMKIQEEIVGKIMLVSGRKSLKQKEYLPLPVKTEDSYKGNVRKGRIEILAIGSSTGGPAALQEVLSRLPADTPVTGVVVQHMPKEFISPFAERLNRLSSVSVMVARHGQLLVPGQFLIAPGGAHLKVARKASGTGTAKVVLDSEPVDSLHRPSVDELFLSVASWFPSSALGVIMTGMGHDGFVGAKEMKKTNSHLFAQDEKSSVVYGMPRAIVDGNLADKVVPLNQMHLEILQALNG